MSAHLSCNDIVTFSKLHMLSRYNDYMGIPDNIEERTHQTNLRNETIIPQQRILLPPTQFGISYPSPSVLAFTSSGIRRPRGEKKPIPEELKDERYFERRKRNNQAAKKSRDARRMREDQIAFRATVLEQENAVLRAQVLTLKEEAHSLRQLLLLQRKTTPYVCLPTNPS